MTHISRPRSMAGAWARRLLTRWLCVGGRAVGASRFALPLAPPATHPRQPPPRPAAHPPPAAHPRQPPPLAAHPPSRTPPASPARGPGPGPVSDNDGALLSLGRQRWSIAAVRARASGVTGGGDPGRLWSGMGTGTAGVSMARHPARQTCGLSSGDSIAFVIKAVSDDSPGADAARAVRGGVAPARATRCPDEAVPAPVGGGR